METEVLERNETVPPGSTAAEAEASVTAVVETEAPAAAAAEAESAGTAVAETRSALNSPRADPVTVILDHVELMTTRIAMAVKDPDIDPADPRYSLPGAQAALCELLACLAEAHISDDQVPSVISRLESIRASQPPFFLGPRISKLIAKLS